MLDRLINWFTVEPAIGLLMLITAIVLFAMALRRSPDDSGAFWPWIRRILEASIGALVFLGLLWAFRSILNTNIGTFSATHGSLTDTNRNSAQSIWGKPHIQRELSVVHYTWVKRQEELPRENPSDPPMYRTIDVREQVPQNTIIGFDGKINMALSEREKGYALYSGYTLDAQFTYQIINDSDKETDAEFNFPMSPGQTLFEDFMITVDDEDISRQLRFGADQVYWERHMKPHQESTVVVSYLSRGMDDLYYQIPIQREIRNFVLTVTIDHLPVDLLNYPEGVLTPTDIQPTADGLGSVLTWTLDRAITVRGMGVALLQPEQPGAQVLRVLENAPYALTMLGAMLALTLLLRGQAVHFLDLALLMGAYSVQFLVMASISDFAFGFWGSLIVGAALTGLLTYLLFRRYPSRLLRTLIYSLVVFFTLIYPLSGLLAETDLTLRNSFTGIVQVGLIVYLFSLALYTRVEQGNSPKQTAA